MSLLPSALWRLALIALLGLGVLSAEATAASQGGLKAVFEPAPEAAAKSDADTGREAESPAGSETVPDADRRQAAEPSLAIEPAAATSGDADQQAAQQIAPVPHGTGPEVKVRVGEHPGFSRLVFDWPMQVGYRVDRAPRRVTVRFDAPARLDLSNFLVHRLQRVSSIDPFEGQASLTVVLDTKAGAEVRHFRDGDRVVIDVTGDGVLYPAPSGPTETAGPPEPEPDQDARLVSAGAQAKGNRPAVLRFDWLPQGARAAVFRRGRGLWIVFDQRSSDGLAGELAEYFPQLAPVERLTVKDGADATVLRVNLPPNRGAGLSRDGNVWVINVGRRANAPRTALALKIADEDRTPRVLLPADGAGRVLSVTDPDLGDTLFIVPLPAPGSGVAAERSFPQFRALATYQGIAIASLSDGLQVEAAESGVSISDRSGLLLSSRADRARAEADARVIDPRPRLTTAGPLPLSASR